MIERFIKILRNAGLEDVTAIEVAEMILLADFIPVAEAPARRGGFGDGERDEQPPQTADCGLQPESVKSPPQASVLDQNTTDAAEDAMEGEGVDVAPFRAPRANALPGERRIARALRPLRKRHPSTRRFILDEEKTIRRIADGGPVTLVLQPAPEAWLEVALVFDESVTMRVWRQTFDRLQHLFERCGYFRDVRAWRLNTESDEAKLYRATAAAAGAPRPLHRPGELLDPAGRRLIVVVSDCHGLAWHIGAAYALVHKWALKCPVALVQVLPEPFWAGTTMTPVDAALRAPKSAATNRLLRIAQAPYRQVVAAGGVALPVVTLDEWAIAPWARVVAGASGISISGLIIPPPNAMALALTAQLKPKRSSPSAPLTAAERVNRFFDSSASKEAKQLARYLASAPLSLPVMQLVQQTMLPQSRQSHLAEVFLSGLLYQSTSHRNPDEVIYEFYAGVREELRRFVTESEIVRVIYEVSHYIESRIGETGNFEAALAVPSAGGVVKRLDPLSLRFATLSADILRRFGRYQESVLKLERLAGLALASNEETDRAVREIHFTPWHLRDRARKFRHDLAKTVQSNFFYSFLFLSAAKRDAIIDVYGFCRAIDDVVDDIEQRASSGYDERAAFAELIRWRHELDALYAGNPTMPISRKLQRVLQQFPMPKEYFVAMIEGCEMDLYRQRYESFEDLYEYCYRVASVTGLMCIEIFTYRSPQTREYAINLGIALQLTNILRDIKEDAKRGRVYLPQEDLRRFGYSEDALINDRLDENFRSLMRYQVERAKNYYRRANELLPEEDRPTLTAALTMGRTYYRLLEQIEQVNYDVFNNQIRLHRPERFLIALNQWIRATGREGEELTDRHEEEAT